MKPKSWLIVLLLAVATLILTGLTACQSVPGPSPVPSSAPLPTLLPPTARPPLGDTPATAARTGFNVSGWV